MRKTLLTLAATTGLLALGAVGASAAPIAPLHDPARAVAADGSAIQQADWCGPRCHYWRHRHWQESHRWWHHHDYYRYGYNDRYYHDYR